MGVADIKDPDQFLKNCNYFPRELVAIALNRGQLKPTQVTVCLFCWAPLPS